MLLTNFDLKFFSWLLLFALITACNVADNGVDNGDNGTPIDEPDIISDFRFDVTVSGSASFVELSFGHIEGATNSYDSGIDIEAPPAPPENVIHAWFENDNRNLFHDFRGQESTETVWILSADLAGNNAILLEWSTEIEELPGNVALTNTGGILVANLQDQQSVELVEDDLDGLQFEFVVN